MNLKYKNDFISIQDYLENELMSEVKHEFINGDIFAMAGASSNHNRLVTNVTRELGNHLKGSPCEPFASDMKVQVGSDFFYPDTMVVCDHQSNENGVTDSPLIIVEVLSKSTRRIDQTLKRTAYQSLPTVQEYVVIEQDVVDIEVCRSHNHWQSEHYFLGDEVYFKSIDFYLSVVEIYDRVENSDMQLYLEALASENV